MHSLDADGKDLSTASDTGQPVGNQSMLGAMLRSEMVPASDVVSYAHLKSLLVRNNYTRTIRSASQTKFDTLHGQAVILVGGFDNLWTMRLAAGLRYRFALGDNSVHEIFDTQHPQVKWTFDNAQNAFSNSEDY